MIVCMLMDDHNVDWKFSERLKKAKKPSLRQIWCNWDHAISPNYIIIFKEKQYCLDCRFI